MASNTNWPLVSTQVAFNTGLATVATPTWTELTPRMWSFSCDRGKQYELDQVQAGTGSIVFGDPDEYLNPANTGSPYTGNLLPYRAITIQAMWPPLPVGSAVNLLNSSAQGVVYDPTFDSNTVGAAVSWIAAVGGTTPLVGTTTPHSGAHDLTWAVVNGATVQGVTFPAPCIPGQQYTASAYVRQSSASTQQISVVGGSAGTSTSTTGAYVRLTVTFTATQPSHTIQVATSGTAVAGTVLLDDVQHEPGASASTFASTGPVIYGVLRHYVERWPSDWNHMGMYGHADVTTVDLFAALAARRMHSAYRQDVANLAPDYYWPLSEADGAASFGEASGNNGPSLTRFDSPYGTPDTFAAGATTNIPGDPGGVGVDIVGSVDASHGATLQSGISGPQGVTVGSNTSSWSLTGAVWESLDQSAITTLIGGVVLGLTSSNYTNARGNSIRLVLYPSTNQIALLSIVGGDAAATFTNPSANLPNLGTGPHLYVFQVTLSGGTYTSKVWVDNVLYINASVTASTTFGTSTPDFRGTYVSAQGFYSFDDIVGFMWGTIAHVSVWNRALSGPEVTSLWTAGEGYFGENSGARIARYLSGIFSGTTSIDVGASTMGADDAPEGGAALDACLGVATTENGNFWVAGQGVPTFAARTRRYLSSTPKWIFGEQELPYEGDIGFDFDPQQIYNDVTVTNSGGAAQVAADATSKLNYGTRTYSRTVNVSTDNEAEDAANWVLRTHKDPSQRLAVMTINPGANPALWPCALGAECGDRIRVVRRTATFTMTIEFFIEKISHNNGPGLWLTTFEASPASLWITPLILDDATFGVLDSNFLGY